ncbi:MAG: hypothetical protein L6R37_007716 [Teloschistes peruensis]|nr:MAG: hypothetical protein L6R37_007716 [Teloschistes peruensis]
MIATTAEIGSEFRIERHQRRIFLFKFAKPDHREQIIVESGFRCHLTSFSRATAATPSPFVAKLRKYLRTKRVTSVAQVGTDRIVELRFSDGQYRLFLEFYAGGNIVLTDHELTVISLLRLVPGSRGQEELRVGLKYGLENRQDQGTATGWTSDRVRAVLQTALDKNSEDHISQTKRKKKDAGDPLRKALTSSISEFPASLVDRALHETGFETIKPIEDVLGNENLVDGLVNGLREAQNIVRGITHDEHSKGYIVARIKPGQRFSLEKDDSSLLLDGSDPQQEAVMYEDFQPFRPLQPTAADLKIIEFETFNKTVDEFFSSIEGQRLESRLTEREQNAKRKIETARQDYEKRIGGLQQVQQLNVRKAQAIETNSQRVQEVISALNGLIAQGMDWVEIARLIEMEQAKNNVVAAMVKLPLKLYENTITVSLAEETFEDDDEFNGAVTDESVSDSEDDFTTSTTGKIKGSEAADKHLTVDIDLSLSPWSNARQYYEQKKTAATKEQKTHQSSAKALKSTEKKINADLKQGLKQEKQVLRPVRRQLWFEKFHCFISSEGYLVLGGKDAQQNEILYKRHLTKGDLYIHADIDGAASVIVKNKPGHLDDPIPPSTLSQAGSFAVATSSAWDSKAVMSAWWVRLEQVSKTTSTGEYLTAGSFSISGEKNFLPPANLLLGFGVLFRVSEESMTRHLKHRLQGDSEERSSNEKEKEDQDDKLGIGESSVGATTTESIKIQASVDEENEEDNGSGRELKQSSEDDEDNKSTEDQHSDTEDRNPLMSQLSEQNISESDQSSDRYSVVSIADESNPRPTSEAIGQEKPGLTTSSRDITSVRHLSARDRSLLRNGQSLNTGDDSTTPATVNKPKTAVDEKPNSTAQKPPVRGKHGKRAKLKTKYANQDEEDRALAMRLLGSAASQKAIDDSAARTSKEAELVMQKQRRRQQHIMAAQKGKEEEEIRRMNLEQGLETLEQAEAETLEDLDAYIGTPFAGDEILDALVVCGPWDAIGTRCKWRVKMQPGAVKKGKAVREILGMWVKAVQDREKKKRPGAGEGNENMMEEEKVRRREGDLLRGLREQEVVGVVPVGKVRVVAGGEGSGVKGRGGAGVGKGKRGGRGSKKQR